MKAKNLLLLVLLVSLQVNSQNLWEKISTVDYQDLEKEVYNKKNFPQKYKLLTLDLSALNSSYKTRSKSTNNIIELPDADGKLRRFQLTETSNFESELQNKYPSIKSYTAKGIDDPTATAKLSIGTDGFHGTIYAGGKSTVYIDPYSEDNQDYIVYQRKDLPANERNFHCKVGGHTKSSAKAFGYKRKVNDGKLRTFRLAIVCSGEYAQFHLTRQNISNSASDATKKAAVLSAMNTSMTRINGVFEKDLGVRMVIVNNNENIIFLDSSTDNITDGNANTMINEVQTICDNVIGNANYDVGHIFSIGGDGLAGLGVVCETGEKARGVTGIASPVNDPYDIDYVAHELGHQFGATHTQNNDCNRTSSTAVEVGSGVTIMGYSGICAPNVFGVGSATGNSDDYFHAVSIAQIQQIINTTGNCASLTDTNNNAPIANAGADRTIPKSTPFKLTGSAGDVEGLSSLTYNWDQIDNGTASMPPVSTNTVGPMFRSLPSKTVNYRYFPDFSTVLAGNLSTTWEVIPSVGRELNFAFLVRDNHSGGGSTARDDVKITVDANSGPFVVATPPTWGQNKTQTLTWSVANTNVAPVNCQNVNILLSTDGGTSFSTTLASNTPNDGSEEITMPNISDSENAYIMIEAADNVFYAITSEFKITNTADFTITNLSGDQSVCKLSSNSVTYTLDFKTSNGFNENTTLSLSQVPNNANHSFSTNNISSDGTVELTISDLSMVNNDNYTIKLTATSSSITRELDVKLTIKDNVCASNGNNEYDTSTTSVTIGTISNNTGKSSSGYGDFKNQSTTVQGGNTFNVSVRVNTDGDFTVGTYAWIDWNQDCDFDDDGEQYNLGTATDTSNGITSRSPLTITVPQSAFNGSTTIRISSKYNGDGNPTACETNFDGEVEDYTLIVEGATSSVEDLSFNGFNLFPNPNSGSFTLMFEVVDTSKTTLELYDVRGRLVNKKLYKNTSSVFAEEIQFDNLSKGLYLLRINNGYKKTTKKLVIE